MLLLRDCLVCVLIFAAALTSGLGAQAPNNDTCDLAISNGVFLVNGSNGGYSTQTATASGVVPSCSFAPSTGVLGGPPVDVWFGFLATGNCPFVFDIANTGLAFPVIALYDGNAYTGPGSCGSLPEMGCAFGPGSSVQVSLNAGDLVLVQVGSGLPGDIGPVTVDVNSSFALSITAPQGPGSISFDNVCGDANGLYLTAVGLAPGNFPNGWFYGVDVGITGLVEEIAFGPPFFGSLDVTGASSWSVPAGIPSGLALYAVSVTLDPLTFVPTNASAPTSFVTP